MEKYFYFGSNTSAKCDAKMINDTTKKLWHGFTFSSSDITLIGGENCTFTMGNVKTVSLPQDKEYAISVTVDGVSVAGRDFGGLMRGFFALLMNIEYENLKIGEEILRIPVFEATSNYKLKNRMIHICVFPDNDKYYIQKLIRLAGVCQYTHIIFEFWGSLKYDCLKELAWQDAFSKEDVKEFIKETRELGMEPIPMFNQLGHATGSRVCHGKHVVLEQNPLLQPLFTPDGWAWNINSSEVKKLLKDIRLELYELFGETEYIHIGCDEAYYYSACTEERKKLPSFLKELTDEVVSEGKRPMIWMDMLLERWKYPDCYATCPAEEVETLTNALNPKTVMVDWQYNIKKSPIPTLESLKSNGFDVMGAPWYGRQNYIAHINTLTENNMFGIMLTTWHTLKEQMPSILGCAKECGAIMFPWGANSGLREETATLLRRVSFLGNNYETSGWTKIDTVDNYIF